MRGILLSVLATRMSQRRAIVISAFLFAAWHFRIERMADIFLGGVVYGWIFLRTRSLLPTILAHFLHNAFSLLAYLSWSESSVAGMPLDAYQLLPAWIAWTATLLILLALLWIKLVPPPRVAVPAGA